MIERTTARAKFAHLREGTAEEWQVISSDFRNFAKELPGRVLDHLRILEGDFGGFPVCRLTHSLQTATLAYKDGRDEEYVVCALLHDIGDTLGSFNHPDVAAAILQPFVSEENLWMVQNHGYFQGYHFFHYLGMDRNMRDKFNGHPWYATGAEFVEKYDAAAFDAKAETMPLTAFEPMVHRLMATPKRTIYDNLKS